MDSTDDPTCQSLDIFGVLFGDTEVPGEVSASVGARAKDAMAAGLEHVDEGRGIMNDYRWFRGSYLVGYVLVGALCLMAYAIQGLLCLV